MTTKYENYATGDDNFGSMQGAKWKAQTCTVGAIGHSITSVKLKIYRVNSPGNFIVSIRALDGSGHPTGDDLAVTTINGNDLDTSAAWVEISFSPFTSVFPTGTFAIVCRAPDATGTNNVYWRLDASSPSYADGTYEASTDSGASWATTSSFDFMFEVYGDPSTVDDSGVGSESVSIDVALPIAESGAGTDTIDYAALLTGVTDSGIGTEEFTDKSVELFDSGLGVDLTYFTQGLLTLDGISLPHVLNMNIQEPSILKDIPVMDDLPYRKQLGKKGRSINLQGWTDSLSTLETLRGYNDGAAHLLVLPTGDSLQVHVTDVLTPQDVEKYAVYDYTLVMVETVE